MSAEAYITAVIIFLNGLVIGSYLNVAIHRIPNGETTFRHRSKCPRCGTGIFWYDNIPVLSFIILKGKCRACGRPISWRYPVVELLTAFLFVAVFYHLYSATPDFGTPGSLLTLVAYLYFGSLMLAAAFIDAAHRIIPNRITYPALIIGPLLLLFADVSRWRGILLGAVIGGGFLFLISLLKRDGMGGGDIKLGLVMGVFLGAPVVVALFFGSLLGAVYGLALVAAKKRSLPDALSFGPFLALGALAAFFWGTPILNWYLGLIGLS